MKSIEKGCGVVVGGSKKMFKIHNKKLLGVILAALFCSTTVFSAPAIYGALSSGLEMSFIGLTDSDGYFDLPYTVGFAVNPTVGIVFAPDSDNFFMRGFGIEASVGLYMASSSYFDALVLSPRVEAVWHMHFGSNHFGEQVVVPRILMGLGVPIAIPSGYNPLRMRPGVFLSLESGVGVEFNVWKKKLAISTDFVLGIPSVRIVLPVLNVGVAYRFK